MESEMSTPAEEKPSARKEYGDDVIVIPRTLAVNIGVAVLFFALGAVTAGILWPRLFPQPTVAAAPAAAPQEPQLPARIDNVNVDDDPAFGPEDAPVTIVEFSDYQCPYCKRYKDQTYAALREQYGDNIRYVFRDFPLTSIHPDAFLAAEAATCAGDQGKYWEMHDTIFANQIVGIGKDALIGFAGDLDLDVDAFTECIESGKYTEEVQKDMTEAQSYGVTGTPSFFINGVRLVGAQPLETFQAVIDAELESTQ
ncbi:MAG: DsbA family protein [Anaerolineae bacterium]|nr:DsbA family protein [Anaerolineae bacterium]